MQIIDLKNSIKNQPLVSSVGKKVEAFQGFLYATIVVIFFAGYAYFFSVNFFSLDEPAAAVPVPLAPEIEALKAQAGISFEGSDGLKKNIEGLKDNTEKIIGGPKGRTNPFDSYAPTRSSR